MDNAIRVSISELIEVRGDGLYAPELVSILVFIYHFHIFFYCSYQ